jgi:hypothetical protein
VYSSERPDPQSFGVRAVIAEIREWLHDVQPVLIAVMLAFVIATAALAYHASTRADSNTVSIATLQQEYLQSQAQGKAFQAFIKAFDTENNYECSVLWYLNEHDPTLPYHPTFSICSVVAP